MTPQEVASKSPAIQFLLAQLAELEKRVVNETDAIADLLRTECNAPKTAQRLEFRTSLFAADLQRQRDLVWKLPDSLLAGAMKPGSLRPAANRTVSRE